MVKEMDCREMFGIGKGGQVSFFVIIAIVIIAGVLVFFIFRSNLFGENIPAEFQPIYTLYGNCIEQEARNGISLLGLQGGRIYTEDYVPGSEYAPFSSHINFLGSPVEYWFYVSGNGIVKENLVTRKEMESELERYLEQGVNECDFSSFYEQGFYVDLEEPKVDVRISGSSVSVEVDSDISSFKEGRSARKTKHRLEVESNLGNMYDTALDVYGKEIDETFIEQYAVDVLRNYAPVDGVEIECGPKIWSTEEVYGSLREGLEANIQAVRFDGDYHKSNSEEDAYFVVDLKVDRPVRLLYSGSWPTSVEVTPANNEIMIAQPVGNDEGLGVMGFCYVPYHFVYDVKFPVLVQINDGFEIFQFPMAVIIDNNLPRDAELLDYVYEGEESADVCEFRDANVRIYTSDNRLNPLEAEVSYKCFDQTCNLGRTEIVGGESYLDAKAPVCVNGELVAEAEGFNADKTRFSSNSDSIADLILNREYEVEIELRVDGVSSDNRAIVSFLSDENPGTAVLPESPRVVLSEGEYEVQVYVYGDSNIVIPASSRTECFKVSRGGLFGILGGKKEECVNVGVPETRLDNVLIGGGRLSTYILESDLEAGKVIVEADSFGSPGSIEELQFNYQAFDGSRIGLRFI